MDGIELRHRPDFEAGGVKGKRVADGWMEMATNAGHLAD